MNAEKIYEKLFEEFRPDQCTEVFPVIGLQEEHTKEIDMVYTATFAGDEVFEKLEEEKAEHCLLFTHHPVQQRENLSMAAPAVSNYAKKVMEQQKITLFSYHIPLDRNGIYSPGNSLAKRIGAVPYEEFYLQNQVRMGVFCNTEFNTVEDIMDALRMALGHPGKCYQYGGERLNEGKIAIMAGGAKSTGIYREMKEHGINTFLTGVTNPSVPWVQSIHREAEKNKINLIGGTHYSTEKFALIEIIKFFNNLGLKARFLEEIPKMGEL